MAQWGLWSGLLILLGIGLWRARLDTEVLNLLPGEIPEVHALKLYQRHFAGARELAITVRGPDAETAREAAEQLALRLRAETNLAGRVLWQAPWLEHPEHMAELIACLWLNQAPEEMRRLADRLAPGRLNAVLEQTRAALATSLSPAEMGRLAYDPFGLTRLPGREMAGDSLMMGGQEEWFAAADGAFRTVFVDPAEPLPDYRASAAWIARINDQVERCRQTSQWPQGAVVRLTGGPALAAEIATGMEKDLRSSALGTMVIIGCLFWVAHRRWRPLGWLVVLLAVIVLGTFSLGGLFLGEINVVSLGFAAILLGLGADYALVLYHEHQARPESTARETRGLLWPGIVWSAATTGAAFLLLNAAGLPGLSQLGTLMAMGIGLAAVVMLLGYLPVAGKGLPRVAPSYPAGGSSSSLRPIITARLALALTAVAMVGCAGTLLRSWPAVDRGTKALELSSGPAQAAMAELQKELDREGETLLLLFEGRDESAVAQSLEKFREAFDRLPEGGDSRRLMLPEGLWPYPERQHTNAIIAKQLAERIDEFRTAATRAGFASNALAIAEGVFATWSRAGTVREPIWPRNPSCEWLIQRFAARTPTGWLAAGMYRPKTDELPSELDPATGRWQGAWLTGWPLLGKVLVRHVENRVVWLLGGILTAIVIGLRLVFKGWREVLLSVAGLGLGLLVLLGTMSTLGWTWNLMNLTALPLLLGAGVDYGIHVQLAMRRQGGDEAAMRRVTGRALALCALTTAVGFGSLAWSGNAGLASLGKICATGIVCMFIVAVFLLPAWWQILTGVRPTAAAGFANGTSSFYGAELWRLGMALVRLVPGWLLNGFCTGSAAIYVLARPGRLEVVARNLRPVVGGDARTARKTGRRLFRQFALKLADLWRYESGAMRNIPVAAPNGWESLQAAQSGGRGVLLVTPHLGNWELGGPLLSERGAKLLVLTQAEPGRNLTDLRRASRARWGIETLVVGGDSFAFVEIIKRLQDGAMVAMLIDRPPAYSAATVELFGRPFQASLAAAELARATGCAVFGVTVVREGAGYVARLLPEFQYDRRALGDRAKRQEFTGQILRAFELEIRQHPDQWYHFVPIWPAEGAAATAGEKPARTP